jgi:hypothetical protein
MMLALPVLLSLASGWALISLGWLQRRPFVSDLLLRASLAAGFGVGIFSVIFFVARIFGFTSLIVADLLVFAALLASYFLFVTRASNATLAPRRRSDDEPAWLHRALTAGFGVALCAALYAAVMRSLAHPHGGGWDAFSIWNLHARFLFRGGVHWRDGFSPLIPWSHPDYPLLLPAAIAHFWSVSGSESPVVPAAVGFIFTFGTAGVLFSSLSILRGRTMAILGATALLATPFFIEQGASQYADVPLGFFFLATIVLLCLHDERRDDPSASHSRGALVMAGIAAGFAAWTKNEGLLFLFAIIFARPMVLLLSESTRESSWRSRKDWIAFSVLLVAAAPSLFMIAWYKRTIGLPGDLLSDPGSWLQKLLAPSRYWAIVKWYVKGFFGFGHWLLIPGTVLLIGFYFVVRGKTRSRPIPGRASVMAVALTLAGYFAIYLITPNDIYWQLRFSLTRLFLQLWPSTIFLFFVSMRNGE